MAERDSHRVFVGTYASSSEEGIHVFDFDEKGMLHKINSISGIENPSFLTCHPSNGTLYAVSETGTYAGEPGGGIESYACNPQTGVWRRTSSVVSHGKDPCYISVDNTGNYAFAANYNGGNAAVWRIEPGGKIGERVALVQHSGSGFQPDRQEAPHPHAIVADPGNRYVLVPDLGLDRIVVYERNASTGELAFFKKEALPPGSGPRHLDFDPQGRHVYVVNELSSTLAVFDYDAKDARFTRKQILPALPERYQGHNTGADIHVAPSGKFVYASNRGHDSIAVFRIEKDDGTLSLVEHVHTQGKNPRNFALSPDGKFLLAANQDSGTIVTFQIDGTTGGLRPTGMVTEVPKPVCIRFAPK